MPSSTSDRPTDEEEHDRMEMFCNQCEQAAHGTGCTKSFGIKPIGASPREDLLAILGHPVEV